MATVTKVKKNLNPELSFLGVIINAFDSHPVITRQIREEIITSFGDRVFRSSLSRSVKIEEALAGRKGVYAGESKVGDEIALIAEELVERVEGKEPHAETLSRGEVEEGLSNGSGETVLNGSGETGPRFVNLTDSGAGV